MMINTQSTILSSLSQEENEQNRGEYEEMENNDQNEEDYQPSPLDMSFLRPTKYRLS